MYCAAIALRRMVTVPSQFPEKKRKRLVGQMSSPESSQECVMFRAFRLEPKINKQPAKYGDFTHVCIEELARSSIKLCG